MNADTDGDWAEAYALQVCHMPYQGRSKSLKVTDSLLLLKFALAICSGCPRSSRWMSQTQKLTKLPGYR